MKAMKPKESHSSSDATRYTCRMNQRAQRGLDWLDPVPLRAFLAKARQEHVSGGRHWHALASTWLWNIGRLLGKVLGGASQHV